MTKANFNVKNYETTLANPEYLKEALENCITCYSLEKDDYVLDQEIHIDSVGMFNVKSYGTWRVDVALTIMGEKKTYSLTHHNEDWYLSRKMVYDPQLADSEEEQKEAENSFQAAFEAVIDARVDEIVSLIGEKIDDASEG